MSGEAYQGLVMDLGVSEGNDTAFYLAKGFKVIAVEADPGACQALKNRFASEIASGALTLLNLAASDVFGATLDIFVHRIHPGISGVRKRRELADDYVRHTVMTIDWRTLVAQAGVPRYVKIDIEGHEAAFLKGFLQVAARPEFVSVECYAFPPVEMLYEAGYRRFRLIDQNPQGGLKLPALQLEGLKLASADFVHCSGPFGLDVFGDGAWMDFAATKAAWTALRPSFGRTWFDCHAWMPN